MPNNPVDTDQQTHLGWLSPSSEGPAGQDHLWLQDPWPGQGSEAPQAEAPVIQFLDPLLKSSRPVEPAPSPEASAEGTGAIRFLEVVDSPVESPVVVWSTDDASDGPQTEPIVFGERGEATVFS